MTAAWLVIGAFTALAAATTVEGAILIGRSRRVIDAAKDQNDTAYRLFCWCSDTFAPAFEDLLARLEPQPDDQPATQPDLPAQPRRPSPGPATEPLPKTDLAGGARVRDGRIRDAETARIFADADNWLHDLRNTKEA